MLTRYALPATVSVALIASTAAAQTLPSAVKWSVALPAQPSVPPLIAGTQIYVALQSGAVAAFRAEDGVEAWRRELRADAPLATDGVRLFVPSGEAIYAWNADGSPAWHANAGTLTSPMLVHDGWLIAPAAAHVTAYRAADGTIVWRRDLGSVSVRPAIEGPTLYLPLDDGRVLAIDLASGNQKWARKLDGAPTEVLPFADFVFTGSADKHVYCLDADDGTIAWRQRIGAALRGRPAADAERLYVVALDNALRAFDRSNGALRWSPRGLPFRPTAGPVLLGGLVVVAGTTKEIHAFAAATGEPAGKLTLPEALATLPDYALAGSRVSIATATGNLDQQWKLSLAESDGVPSTPLEPLTALPGLTVPIPTPPGR